MDAILRPWPWYVAGPAIGCITLLLLLVGGKSFGFSENLRHICAAVLPRRSDLFRYDWRERGGLNLAFAVGTLLGGFLAARFLSDGSAVAISAATQADLRELGLGAANTLAPPEVFSFSALFTRAGAICLVVGGFLVGFGTRYAGGCTSGHGISGLGNLQTPSLIAVAGFFLGGIAVTRWVLPWVLGGLP